MAGKTFELTEATLSVIEEIGGHMPGGLFIYKAAEPEELIYANKPVFDIFRCANLDEFKALTGFTFKGMVHPDDYDRISVSIAQQIDSSEVGGSAGWTIMVTTVRQRPMAASMWCLFRI